ncbi:ORF131 [Ranid herpesvirus 2]|uniref:ORF131 n=1 Tax=Ranid herpesvirus 2 TaxID=389214 RepID=Q14VX5_9VIRU|nr:ORF131 [Ranid herpesvirus 2]ABG25604.1 ORF131 [Ranid herpesvirus 2]
MNLFGRTSDNWIAMQSTRPGEFYAPPLGEKMIEDVPMGIFVRVVGRNDEGHKLFHPSFHGEKRNVVNAHFPAPHLGPKEYVAFVTRSLATDLSASLTLAHQQQTVVNTSKTPMRCGDIFVVSAPDCDDMAAQQKHVWLNDSLASAGGSAMHNSMVKLAGGLLATQVIPPNAVDDLSHKVSRDIDYLSALDTTAAHTVPCPALQFGMQTLYSAFQMHNIFVDGNAQPTTAAAIIKKYADYVEGKNPNPPTLSEMKGLIANDKMKMLMCDGMAAMVDYYKLIVQDTCGVVLSSFFNNPTSIHGEAVYGPTCGHYTPMSAVIAFMFKYNGI